MSPAARQVSFDPMNARIREMMAAGRRISSLGAQFTLSAAAMCGDELPGDIKEYLEAAVTGRPWPEYKTPAGKTDEKPAAGKADGKVSPPCGVEGCPSCSPSSGPPPRTAGWLLEFMKLAGEVVADPGNGTDVTHLGLTPTGRLRQMAKAAGETTFAVAVGPHVLVVGANTTLVLPLLGMMAVPDMRV